MWFMLRLLLRRLSFFFKCGLELLEEWGNGGLGPGVKVDLRRLRCRLSLILWARKETLLEGLSWLWLRSRRALGRSIVGHPLVVG